MNNASDAVLKLVTAALASMAMLGMIYVGGRLILGDDILLPLMLIRSAILWMGGGLLVVAGLAIVCGTLVSMYAIHEDYRPSLTQLHPDFKFLVKDDGDGAKHSFHIGQPKEVEAREDAPQTIDAPEWHTVPNETLT